MVVLAMFRLVAMGVVSSRAGHTENPSGGATRKSASMLIAGITKLALQ
jgi:hypothetical protein